LVDSGFGFGFREGKGKGGVLRFAACVFFGPQ